MTCGILDGYKNEVEFMHAQMMLRATHLRVTTTSIFHQHLFDRLISRQPVDSLLTLSHANRMCTSHEIDFLVSVKEITYVTWSRNDSCLRSTSLYHQQVESFLGANCLQGIREQRDPQYCRLTSALICTIPAKILLSLEYICHTLLPGSDVHDQISSTVSRLHGSMESMA